MALVIATIPASSIAAEPPAWEAPPGWAQTKGGEGGKVFVVENLNAEGPGSIGEAVAAQGRRVVTFKVAGVIDLHEHGLRLRNPEITIAGETAPSPGITLTNAGVFTANSASGAFTQASTSGAGTGATFVSALFAPNTLTVASSGAYSLFQANPVAQGSTTGTGAGANTVHRSTTIATTTAATMRSGVR